MLQERHLLLLLLLLLLHTRARLAGADPGQWAGQWPASATAIVTLIPCWSPQSWHNTGVQATNLQSRHQQCLDGGVARLPFDSNCRN
jgi:hypothetical protein